jgi:methyl-accepting chemotaxis protein
MSQTELTRRRRLPLAFRLSLILILAAVVPLAITVLFSEYYARPDLINQANNAMSADAQTRMQLINFYLTQRMSDAATLSQVPSVQKFLLDPTPAQDPTPTAIATYQADLPHAGYALAAGKIHDPSYISWDLFYKNGTLALYYPQNLDKQKEAVVPPEYVQAMQQGASKGLPILSPVYYDPAIQKAFVDIYAPIYQGLTPSTPFVGFMRAKLSLDYIWGIVKQDKGVNNSGYSFILDEHGVRIAETNGRGLWTSVSQLPQPLQQQMAAENWYGNNAAAPVQADSTLAGFVNGSNKSTTFTITPNGQNQEYQAARATAAQPNTTPVVAWNYFVVSPSSVVTQVADDQLRNTIIVAAVVALLAALVGWWVSSRITRPILRSVDQLRENTETLNGLAKKQQSASSEQLWVVDSIQVGLQSVQYYTDATRIAAHKLGEVGMELERNWYRQNIETIKQGLQQVISAANYIEKATHYQGDSSQKLSTAIKVTTQVNEQLADGAISATETASQLEQVVNDLRNVVGQ